MMKPLGDSFIGLLKMMLGPIIFCTVVHGVGHISDFRKLGRLGIKTLFYFEVVSTLAMLVGFTRNKPAVAAINQITPSSSDNQTLVRIGLRHKF